MWGILNKSRGTLAGQTKLLLNAEGKKEEFLLYPNYLCVFRANQEVHDDVLDCGLDPDFRPPIPTWGICRPLTRRSVVPGSYVVFLGYYAKDQRYLVKGWMRVGEKIGYLNALERFGNRPNVIVRKLPDHEARQPSIPHYH